MRFPGPSKEFWNCHMVFLDGSIHSPYIREFKPLKDLLVQILKALEERVLIVFFSFFQVCNPS